MLPPVHYMSSWLIEALRTPSFMG